MGISESIKSSTANLLCCLVMIIITATTVVAARNDTGIDITDLGYYSFKSFSYKNELPQSTINALAMDAHGYLWAATQEGAAYYNGRKWYVVNMPNQAISNKVRVLLSARDGTLWFGTDSGGLIAKKDDKWTVYDTTTSAIPGNNIRTLLETSGSNGESVLWVGTYLNGLARFANGQWTNYDQAAGLPNNTIYSLQATHTETGERIWIGTDGGLAIFEQNRITKFGDHFIGRNGVLSLLETKARDGKSTIWAGTNAGLVKYANGEWSSVDIGTGLTGKVILSLLETRSAAGDSTLWVGTFGGGLARYEADKWRVFNTNNSNLLSNRIRSLLEMRTEQSSSTIWIGTLGGGLARLELSNWINFNTRSGLPNDFVYSFYESRQPDSAGEIWIGTDGGLTKFSQGEWTSYDIKNGLPNNVIYTLLETDETATERALWVGTYGGGLAKLSRGSWSYYNTTNGLPNNIINRLLETIDNTGRHTLWVATDGGIACWANERWTVYTTAQGLPNNVVYTLFETRQTDGSKILWAGTKTGLAFYQHNRWQMIGNSSELAGRTIYCLQQVTTLSGQPLLLAGTDRMGFYAIDLTNNSISWAKIGQNIFNILSNRTINQIETTANRDIYFFTNRGIIRLTPLSDKNPDEQYRIASYTIEDGLPSLECNRGAAMIDSAGRIWAGTVVGAAVFDPRREVINRAAKPLHLEQVQLNGKDITAAFISKPPPFAYNENNFVLEYTLLSFFREDESRYRYQLIGYDPGISEWWLEAKKEYANLPAGDYTFMLWGKDYAGNISGPIKIAFTIKPAPWFTWWAYCSYFLFAGSITYGWLRLRFNMLQTRNRELEKIVTERTSEVVRNKDELAEKNRQILDSIHYAGRIQEAMLPFADRFTELVDEYFILFKPKDIISGDFYWINQVSGSIIVALADCTGHGVPGALMSMIGNSLLNQIVLEKGTLDPAQILAQLDRGIRATLKHDEQHREFQDGMDIALCRIELSRSQLTFAGARRPLYFINNNGSLIEVKGDRMSLGARKQMSGEFTNHTFAIDDQIICYFTTDGFADQSGTAQTKYGSRRLKEFLAAHSKLSLHDQYQALSDELRSHQNNETQRDDISILGIKIKVVNDE